MEEFDDIYQPESTNVELAKERNRVAAERTLMAWIRTSLSMIGFGCGIYYIIHNLNHFNNPVNEVRLSKIIGLSFVALGVFALVMASIQHIQELKHIRRSHYVYVSKSSLGLIVGIALIIIGLVAFIGISNNI